MAILKIIRACDDLVFWATNNLPPQSNEINHSQGNYVRVWIYLSCCCAKFMYFYEAVMRTMRVWFIMWWALFATFNHRLCIWHVLWNATLSFMTEVFPANSISFRQGSCTILHVNRQNRLHHSSGSNSNFRSMHPRKWILTGNAFRN